MKPAPPTSHYRADIDGLRAIAIVSVVLFHAFPKFLRGAFFGVDIFFVISGYLISAILIRDYARRDFIYSRFYFRRARRIFPALFVVLALITLAGWFLLLPQEYARFGKHLAAGVGFVSNLALLNESGYFDSSAVEKPLLHLWSLGVEEQYYLFWPLVIGIALHIQLLIYVIGTIILLSFLGNIFFIQHYPDAVFYLPFTRFWELASGGLISAVHFHYPKGIEPWLNKPPLRFFKIAGWKEWLSVLGVMLLISSYFVIQSSEGFPGTRALLPVSATVLLILAGPHAWINRNVFSNRLLVYLGLISYPLYLWHWPLLSLESIIDNGRRDRQIILIILVLSILFAHLTWRWVETPVRRKRKLSPVLALTTLLFCLGVWGGWVFYAKGYPGRMAGYGEDMASMELSMPRWNRTCPKGFKPDNMTLCLFKSTPSTQGLTKGVLLTGDSHAVAFAGAAKYLAEGPLSALSMRVLAKGGCMPFAWMEMLNSVDDCHPFYRDLYAMAATDPALQTIILVGRWAIRLNGKGFGFDEMPLHLFRDVRLTDAAPKQEELFEKGLRETLTTLTHTGRDVIFVHQVPELGFKPNYCLSRPYSLYPRHPCTIPREVVEARQAPYRAIVADILNDFPGVRVFDPLPYLCDDQACRARINGVFLYSDDDHLSNEGARLLGMQILATINSAR